MSLPDPSASAALGAMVIKPVFFVYLDIVGGVVRCNTSGANVTPSGTGEPALDGKSFIGISGDFVDLSPIGYGEGGSKSATATLSGIPGIDDAVLNLLGDAENWRGRDARAWQIIRNSANTQQGGYREWAGGKIANLTHGGEPGGGLTITVTIEGYLASLSQASNRTYLDQELFDEGDQSAKASIAIANGNFSGAVVTPSYNNNPYALPFGIPGMF